MSIGSKNLNTLWLALGIIIPNDNNNNNFMKYFPSYYFIRINIK